MKDRDAQTCDCRRIAVILLILCDNSLESVQCGWRDSPTGQNIGPAGDGRIDK